MSSLEPIHVLRESESPVGSVVWKMWCGASCAVFSDGSLVPNIDFHLERWSRFATCLKCLENFKLFKTRSRAEVA